MKLILHALACLLSLVFTLPVIAAADGREEWDKVLRAAKQEGRVVLYTFPGQELVFQEFQKKFSRHQARRGECAGVGAGDENRVRKAGRKVRR